MIAKENELPSDCRNTSSIWRSSAVKPCNGLPSRRLLRLAMEVSGPAVLGRGSGSGFISLGEARIGGGDS